MNSYKYSRGGVDRASSFDAPIELGGYVHLIICVAAAFALILAGNSKSAVAAEAAANVDAARMTGADRDPANWMTDGRTYSEQRFSPLSRINAENAKQLGLAWYADLDSHRGQEATPLVIDGVMYVSGAWSIVKAYDAKTGALFWSYDPAVPRVLGVKGCCDVVSRGVAAATEVLCLSGQYTNCTAIQLRMWQRGFRKNSPEAMALFAKKLDEQQIAAVAAYYQQARGATTDASAPKR